MCEMVRISKLIRLLRLVCQNPKNFCDLEKVTRHNQGKELADTARFSPKRKAAKVVAVSDLIIIIIGRVLLLVVVAFGH